MKDSREKDQHLTASQVSLIGFTFRNVNSKKKIKIYYREGSSALRVQL